MSFPIRFKALTLCIWAFSVLVSASLWNVGIDLAVDYGFLLSAAAILWLNVAVISHYSNIGIMQIVPAGSALFFLGLYFSLSESASDYLYISAYLGSIVFYFITVSTTAFYLRVNFRSESIGNAFLISATLPISIFF